MDNYRMNRGGYRSGMPGHCQQPRPRQSSCQYTSGCAGNRNTDEMFRHLDDHLPVAMGYVPFQKWGKTFELNQAFQIGTIFPDLCKPFCGKGGGVCQ